MEKKGVSSVPVLEESRPGGLPYVLTDIMTYFTMLVGIYFPSVTGEAPSLPSSSVFVSVSLCVPTMTLSLSDSFYFFVTVSVSWSVSICWSLCVCLYFCLSVLRDHLSSKQWWYWLIFSDLQMNLSVGSIL